MVRTPSQMIDLGNVMPEFRLENVVDGSSVSSKMFSGRIGLVLFICNHCPYVIRLMPAMAEILNAQLGEDFAVVAISANDPQQYPADSPEHMKHFAHENKFEFPYLFDSTQEIARRFGAVCTPDLFMYDAQGRLVYRGQFDDARPSNQVPVSGNDVLNALKALRAGLAVSTEQTPSTGCSIKWR